MLRILASLGANNLQTVLGHNMFNITQECKVNLHTFSSNFVKKNLHYHEISEENVWKVDFTKELLNLRPDNLVIPGLDKNNLSEIFRFKCCDLTVYYIFIYLLFKMLI